MVTKCLNVAFITLVILLWASLHVLIKVQWDIFPSGIMIPDSPCASSHSCKHCSWLGLAKLATGAAWEMLLPLWAVYLMRLAAGTAFSPLWAPQPRMVAGWGACFLLAASPAADSAATTASLVRYGAGSMCFMPVAGSPSLIGTPSHKGAHCHMFN